VLFILTGASTYLGKRFNDGTCRETVVWQLDYDIVIIEVHIPQHLQICNELYEFPFFSRVYYRHEKVLCVME
jgi:hypothetical protein